jgi:hypothetical protein
VRTRIALISGFTVAAVAGAIAGIETNAATAGAASTPCATTVVTHATTATAQTGKTTCHR